MWKVLNGAKMMTATVGIGPITLGSAVDGFLTWAEAGAQNGDDIGICIEDGGEREFSHGTYTASGTVQARTLIASTTGSLLNLSGSARVFSCAIVPAAGGIFVERTATQTLTNKTLTSPVINTPTGIVKGDVGLGNVDNTSDTNKPVSSAQQTALDAKIPTTYLDTDTTLAANSDTKIATQKATKAHVAAAIAALVSSAPGVLDTLDELAAALGDDANFAATVTSALAAKAPIASPQFSGTLRYGYNYTAAGTDLNDLIVPGFYDGNSFANAPDGTASWFHVIVLTHPNPSGGWNVQIAFNLDADATIMWGRNRVNGSWQAWKRFGVAHSANGASLVTAADYAAMRTLLSLAAIATSASAADLSAGTLPDARLSAAATPYGKQSVPIAASAMVPNTTNGPASGSAEMSTNKNMFVTLDFDPSTSESAQFAIPMPFSWNEGTVTFQPVWSHPSTSTNFGVVWELSAVAISNDDAGDVAFGTGQTSIDAGGTTNDIYVGPESSAITVAGSPAAGDLVMFKIARLPANASDTMAVDARLHAISLNITTNAGNDA